MDLHISLAPEVLFHVGPIPVTNSMFTMFIVMIIVFVVFTAIARRLATVPGRAQSIAEILVEFISGLVESTGGRKFGRRVLPLCSGLFLFILFANLSGLIPTFGTLGVWRTERVASGPNEVEAVHRVLVPIFRAPTADLNMTLAMALVAFTIVQIVGIRSQGLGGRFKHMAQPPWMFPIELVSELSRILSLTARLFGNVFAGEVLLALMYAAGSALKVAVISFLFPVVFLGLELAFGAIQAVVFGLLTAIYLVLAAPPHDEHGDEHAADHQIDDVPGARSIAPASAGD